jgi:hypothetical protein
MKAVDDGVNFFPPDLRRVPPAGKWFEPPPGEPPPFIETQPGALIDYFDFKFSQFVSCDCPGLEASSDNPSFPVNIHRKPAPAP